MNAVSNEAQPARFVDTGDGTVTDSITGLMWSKATLSAKDVTHAKAEKICTELDLAGYTDWRLPTDHELLSLVDRARYKPAIDTDAFPDTASDWYWASTPLASDPSLAWIVLFSYGSCLCGHRGSDLARVRAVRSVPAGQ
ncbi:DUF1566 domain-containing protein [Lysobacter sp. 5GHs7-4]|uniref:Lcl C-terminal domain-containing protein n=1 Tax=Lysobacter sp. 5GHs7-4 TaxID=2904253 RepID=UPI001E31485E|nr:DUF1566 domain-containing protein [Lysobacter sp. 5GHs7-4]UHQ21932.1 DUF1566 domain-containing protein [Lysobacter sp. 5GHs7-4]